jgi:Ca-activated chloride channel family protein
MEFQWPTMLWGLLFVPILVAMYILILRRRKGFTIRYSSLALMKDAGAKPPSWRRHIPPFLFLLAIAAMLFALSRPFSIITLPSQEGVVILAIDVSGSMRANDVQPSRIEAAKTAALDFIDQQDSSTRIGVVAFSGNAALVQAPTTDHQLTSAAINRLFLGPRTGIGTAILTSVDAAYETLYATPDTMGLTANPAARSSLSAAPSPTPRPVAPGYHIPAIVVLLTDGQSNVGPAPQDAARLAADRGVRVFTIGIGTTTGATIGGGGCGGCGGQGGPGGPGGGGGGFRTALDENTLMEVARITDAKYFYAKDASDLRDIYRGLNTQSILRTQRSEITFAFTASAVILLLVGATLSILWFNRLG